MSRMTYKVYYFNCRSCQKAFHKILNVSDLPSDVDCTECNEVCAFSDRIIPVTSIRKASNYATIGAKVEDAEWNYGLGTVTKSARHRAEVARRKGLVEVGNDFGSGEKMQKEFEKKKKEELDSNWNKDPKGGFVI